MSTPTLESGRYKPLPLFLPIAVRYPMAVRTGFKKAFIIVVILAATFPVVNPQLVVRRIQRESNDQLALNSDELDNGVYSTSTDPLQGREEIDPGSVDAKTVSRLISKFAKASSTLSSASQFKPSSSFPPPPIILIPGLASSQLHSWSSPPSCPSLRLFTLVWLHLPTMAKIFSTKNGKQARCWMEAMKLRMDESDPEVRALSRGVLF